MQKKIEWRKKGSFKSLFISHSAILSLILFNIPCKMWMTPSYRQQPDDVYPHQDLWVLVTLYLRDVCPCGCTKNMQTLPVWTGSQCASTASLAGICKPGMEMREKTFKKSSFKQLILFLSGRSWLYLLYVTNLHFFKTIIWLVLTWNISTWCIMWLFRKELNRLLQFLECQYTSRGK